MKSRILPAYCTNGRPLTPQGIVIHYFSAKNVDGPRALELEACRNLFLDLNRAKSERQFYMREGEKWPTERMFASAHVLIGRDGGTWKLVEFDRQAYHAGKSIMNERTNCNGWTLGIELVGTITSKFTDAQYGALGDLLIDLMARYGISRERIQGHDTVRAAAIAAGHSTERKYDPSGRWDGQGDNFDWPRLWRIVEGFELKGPERIATSPTVT